MDFLITEIFQIFKFQSERETGLVEPPIVIRFFWRGEVAIKPTIKFQCETSFITSSILNFTCSTRFQNSQMNFKKIVFFNCYFWIKAATKISQEFHVLNPIFEKS